MMGERIRERQSRCREPRCAGGVLKTTGPAWSVISSQSFGTCLTNEAIKLSRAKIIKFLARDNKTELTQEPLSSDQNFLSRMRN